MKTVQRIAIEAVNESIDFLKEGISEIRLGEKLHEILKLKGIEETWYPTGIYFSHRTRLWSKKFLPSEAKLKKGDIISIRIHPVKDKYMGDYSLATIFGENQELQEFVNNAREIELKTIEFASAKSTAKEVFDYSSALINEFGYSLLDLRGNIGHDIGRLPGKEIKFQRKFLDTENTEILDGKFWTIEPFIGNKEFGAVFEDIIYMGKTGKTIIK